MMESRFVKMVLRYLAAAVLGGFLGWVTMDLVFAIINTIEFRGWAPPVGRAL